MYRGDAYVYLVMDARIQTRIQWVKIYKKLDKHISLLQKSTVQVVLNQDVT